MKTLITTILLILSLNGFAQDKIKVNDGVQKGTLVLLDGKYLQNGIWKSDYAKAKYDMGKLVWIHPKGNRKWSYDEIMIVQMQNKIKKLESAIATSNK
jgi:hypothetical protein